MRTHRWFSPWLFIFLGVGWLIVFTMWPALNTLILSFTNVRLLGGGRFIGIQNYIDLLSDDQLANAILNSVIYMLVCVPILTVGPLLLAMLVQKPLAGMGLFRTAFYLPVVASVVAAGVIWQFMLSNEGAINSLFQALTILQEPLPFLTDRWLILMSAILLTLWKGMGYYMVIYLVGLANISPGLHEAAAVDGAGRIQQFFHITIPSIKTTMLLVSVLIAVAAMRVFSELYVLTNGAGGPGGQDMSMVMLIQQNGAGSSGRLGYASALSVLLFVITLVPLLFLARMNRKTRQ